MTAEDLALGANMSCFIISPIGSKLEPVGSPGRNRYEESAIFFEEVVEPACAVFGLNPIRADRIAETGEIPDQIFTYLRDADIVIADLSHANPNVMYELGLRHSIQDKITIQVGEYGLLPFDVTTIRTIQFKRTTVGLISVRDGLTMSIRAALQGGGTPIRATTVFASGATVAPARLAEDLARSARDDDSEGEDTGPGFLDILVEGEASTDNLSVVLGTANDLMLEVGEITGLATERINSADAAKKGFAGRLLVMRELAKELSGPANAFEVAANEFYVDTQNMDAMVRFIAGRYESGEQEIDEDGQALIGSVIGLSDAAEQSSAGVLAFRDGTRGLAKMANDLRPTAKILSGAAGRFIEGFELIMEWRSLLEPFQNIDEA